MCQDPATTCIPGKWKPMAFIPPSAFFCSTAAIIHSHSDHLHKQSMYTVITVGLLIASTKQQINPTHTMQFTMTTQSMLRSNLLLIDCIPYFPNYSTSKATRTRNLSTFLCYQNNWMWIVIAVQQPYHHTLNHRSYRIIHSILPDTPISRLANKLLFTTFRCYCKMQ